MSRHISSVIQQHPCRVQAQPCSSRLVAYHKLDCAPHAAVSRLGNTAVPWVDCRAVQMLPCPIRLVTSHRLCGAPRAAVSRPSTAMLCKPINASQKQPCLLRHAAPCKRSRAMSAMQVLPCPIRLVSSHKLNCAPHGLIAPQALPCFARLTSVTALCAACRALQAQPRPARLVTSHYLCCARAAACIQHAIAPPRRASHSQSSRASGRIFANYVVLQLKIAIESRNYCTDP